MSGKSYRGIDIFRALAAILIVTIHTSPFMTYSVTADFILTRIIARVAVPFFFMTSGFFLVSKYSENNERLKWFIKKTAVIYAVSIFIYLPINIYNDYFKEAEIIPKILKDIVFDGTMYHLWYLPASIIGAMIAWAAVKRLGYKKALAVASVLYIIGLLGDSYYGAAERIPILKGFYSLIFQISDYTRNGIFFAPLFFVLGGMFGDGLSITKRKAAVGFAASFGLMTLEAMLLHRFEWQRHDSMYIFLPVSMVFLFNLLVGVRSKRLPMLRDLSLIVYVIHPMVIVFVRMAAKIFGLQGLLIENSIVHFVAVSIISIAASIVLALMFEKVKRSRAYENPDTDRAWVELDLSSLKHNVNVLNDAMPDNCSLMAVVKARAYGHGAFKTAVYLEKIGVKAFAVATIDEGIELRKYGISSEILVLGYTLPQRAKDLKKYNITQTLVSYEHALAINACGVKVKSHIKLDTGMHRLGFEYDDFDRLWLAFGLKNICVTGIYTHLCASDSLADDAVSFTNKQIERFYAVINSLRETGVEIPKTHIQSSYGLMNYPELNCDYIRAGVALYGVLSSDGDETRIKLDLRPALSLKSRVVLIRNVKKGEAVGYGMAFRTEKDSTIAIITIGYADGLPRSLSCGNGGVIINGQYARIVGRICMDQMAVDITGLAGVEVGAVAEIIGGIAAETVAGEAGSITNEVLSRLGGRLKIVEKY